MMQSGMNILIYKMTKMTKRCNDNTFMKITNHDVYEKLCSVEDSINELSRHVIATNGRVKLNRWISTTGLTLVTSLIIILVGLKTKGVI